MIINQTNLANLFKGYKASFNTGFRSVKPIWQSVATEVTSSTKTEQYGWLGQYPRLREWIGDRVIKSIEAHGYSITNKKFESTIGVPRDDIEDDTYGLYSPLFQEMGFAAATHPDELVFELLPKGFETECYDGQYFFDTDHPVRTPDGKEVSVSNMLPGSDKPWFLMDTRRPLKPIIFQKRRGYDFKHMDDNKDENVFMRDEYVYGIDARCNVGWGFWQQAFGSKTVLDRAAFRELRTAMSSQKSDEGRPLGIRPNLLVVGPGNADAARDIVLAERKDGGASNTDYKLVDILEVEWLA